MAITRMIEAMDAEDAKKPAAAAQPVAAEAAKAGPKVHAKAIAAHVVESAVMAAGYNHKQDSFTAVANHANQIRRALTKAGLPAWAIDAAMDAAKKASDFRDGRARKVSSGPIVASLRQNGFILDEQVAPDDPAARAQS